jgi:hypothetical protein
MKWLRENRRRLVRLFIDAAEQGDMRMAKLILDRMLPAVEAQKLARPASLQSSV